MYTKEQLFAIINEIADRTPSPYYTRLVVPIHEASAAWMHVYCGPYKIGVVTVGADGAFALESETSYNDDWKKILLEGVAQAEGFYVYKNFVILTD